MKQITYFYLEGCPHCKNADKMITALIEQHPEYAAVKFNKIEERQNAALADSYDYYYVPCFYIDGEKVHEGVPTVEKIENAIKLALK